MNILPGDLFGNSTGMGSGMPNFNILFLVNSIFEKERKVAESRGKVVEKCTSGSTFASIERGGINGEINQVMESIIMRKINNGIAQRFPNFNIREYLSHIKSAPMMNDIPRKLLIKYIQEVSSLFRMKIDASVDSKGEYDKYIFEMGKAQQKKNTAMVESQKMFKTNQTSSFNPQNLREFEKRVQKSINEMKSITCENLVINHISVNQKMFLTVDDDGYDVAARHLMVTDGKRLIRFLTYNLSKLEKKRICQIGQKFILLHPFYKLGMDGTPILRVDVFRDHIRFTEEEEEEKDSHLEEILNEAKLLFKKKDYVGALGYYSQPVFQKIKSLRILNNRILCHLKLRSFEDALQLIETFEQQKNENPILLEKYFYLKVLTLLNLKKFKGVEKELLKIKNPEIIKTLTKKMEMMKSQSLGTYDILKIIMNPTSNFLTDFKGDCEIKFISEKKGRGMISKKDFSIGDLIMTAQPIAKIEKSEEGFILGNSEIFGDGEYNTEDHQKLRKKIVNMIELCPCFKNKMKFLSSGKEIKHSDEELGIKTISKIVATNMFDIHQIEFKKIFLWEEDATSKKNNYQEYEEIYSSGGSGLYFLPSFFNHKCIPNCSWITIGGDCMFITACKEIKKGDELFLNYYQHGIDRKRFVEQKGVENCLCDPCNASEELINISKNFTKKTKENNNLETIFSNLKEIREKYGETCYIMDYLMTISDYFLDGDPIIITEEQREVYFCMILKIIEKYPEMIFLMMLMINKNPIKNKQPFFRFLQKYRGRIWDVFQKSGFGNKSNRIFQIWVKDICFTCRKKCDLKTKLFHCARCEKVLYCGRKCQIRDWKRGHKLSCKKKN